MFTPKQLRQILGDPAEIAECLRQSKVDHSYFDAHRTAWLKEHGEQWVCVYKKELVAIAPTIEELLAKVDNADVPRSNTVIKHLKPFEGVIILTAA